MTYIVSLATVRTILGLNSNVENDKLESYLDAAHEYMRERLGDDCYAEFIAAIEADSDLDQPENAKWLALITNGADRFLAWLTYHLSMPRLHSEADRAGFFAKSGSDYQSVDGATLGRHQSSAKDMYTLYERKLLAYIATNRSDYESLTTGDNPGNTSADTQFPGGIITVPSPYSYGVDEIALDPESGACNV